MESIYNLINRDKQIWKFCFYGLLKNLQFFEPYLLIYLMSMKLSLFQMGLLFSVREIVIYIFEIPSGIFADNYGKKTELLICFIFYIVSFIFFFIGTNFTLLVIAIIFYGLGEAFRSGAHKAMIYLYLEQKGWFKHKAYVYGRTRSFSLIGSSISAFLSIIFILNLPGMRWIFLVCTLPFFLDFLLILSYPESLNEKIETDLSMKKFFSKSVNGLRSILKKKVLIKLLLSASLFDGIFKTIKDYIQPILKTTLLLVGASALASLDGDSKLKIILGITYGVFYIFSSITSKNVYRLNKKWSSDKLMNISFDIMGILSIGLFLAVRNKITSVIIIIFFLLYILKDARKPVFVDVCGDYMDKNERATVLSIESQLISLFTVILAPLFGFIADRFSINVLFLCVGVLILVANRFLGVNHKQDASQFSDL